MNEWIGYSAVESFLENEGFEAYIIDMDEYGINISGYHLDVYSMKYDGCWLVDWDGSPECKREDVKDLFANLFSDWTLKYNELLEIE